MHKSETHQRQIGVALIGAPNSGKTTLYNWLTGSKFKTVNYPGATVEYSLGALASHLGEGPLVMDTPGTYSLHPKSADEMVTLKALYENPDLGTVAGIVVVLDGTHLSRHLLLAEQVKDTGFPMILVVTMADLLKKQGLEVDVKKLSETYACPVVIFDGSLGGGLFEIAAAIKGLKMAHCPSKPMIWNFAETESKIRDIEALGASLVVGVESKSSRHAAEGLQKISEFSLKLDRLLLHPILGFVSFVLIMGLLFSSIFWAAAPAMDIVDSFFASGAERIVNLAPGSLWTDFLGNGIVASFGAALVFVPQIFILFFGIGLLEGSGYLARAATVIDKPFSWVGMSGRSFVPILSGFACAVPAMIATRNISSARDRWITTFIVPLMTCSARLPVYALLLAFVFKGEASWKPGLALAALYLGSVLIGGLVSAVLNKVLPKKDLSFFMMELPIYRRPRLRVLLRQSYDRTKSYVFRAGPAIFLFAVSVWATSTFPNYELEDPQARLEQSYLGQVGKVLDPVMQPMGSDWRVGIGMVSAFAAREVFVSTLAIVFNITTDDELEQENGLMQKMSAAVQPDGSPLFSVASVAAILVFFMIALQCMSTVAVAAKEMASWKFAISQLVAFNLLAYVLSVAVYQSFSFFGL